MGIMENKMEDWQGGLKGGCTLNIGMIGTTLGFYGDNGKENGNYYNGHLGFRLKPDRGPSGNGESNGKENGK